MFKHSLSFYTIVTIDIYDINLFQLTMTPTPITRWALPGAPKDVEVYIKRDDLTGCSLTGTKVTSNQMSCYRDITLCIL